jgi:hypothetical protein
MGNEMEDMVREVMCPIVYRMLGGMYKTKAYQLSSLEIKKKIIPVVVLRQALKNNKLLNDLNDNLTMRSNPVNGFDKLMKYMLGSGYLVECDSPHIGKKKKCVRVTGSLDEVLMELSSGEY